MRVTGYSYYGVTSVESRSTDRGMSSVYVRPCVHKSCYECGCHEVVCLRIRAEHMNFYVFTVYRNPGVDDSLLDCLLTTMSEVQQTARKSSFVFVGDLTHITESGLAQSLRLTPMVLLCCTLLPVALANSYSLGNIINLLTKGGINCNRIFSTPCISIRPNLQHIKSLPI